MKIQTYVKSSGSINGHGNLKTIGELHFLRHPIFEPSLAGEVWLGEKAMLRSMTYATVSVWSKAHPCHAMMAKIRQLIHKEGSCIWWRRPHDSQKSKEVLYNLCTKEKLSGRNSFNQYFLNLLGKCTSAMEHFGINDTSLEQLDTKMDGSEASLTLSKSFLKSSFESHYRGIGSFCSLNTWRVVASGICC